MSIQDEPITGIATALGWISLTFFDYGRRLATAVALLTTHAKWQGDAAGVILQEAHRTAKSLQDWNAGVKELEGNGMLQILTPV